VAQAQVGVTSPAPLAEPTAISNPQVIEPATELIAIETKLKIDPAQKEDVKDLLRIEAVKQLISTVMKSKGLSEEEFWKHFILTKEGKELNSFLEIASSGQISRAANEADLYFTNFSFKFNSSEFEKIYQNTISTQEDDSSIVLRIDYDLSKLNWQELGVTYKEDFTHVVEESWLKWLKELDPRLSKIEISNESPSKGHEIYIKLRMEKRGEINPLNPGLMIHFGGGVYMRNMQTKNILFAQKLEDADEFYSSSLKNGFSSAIANYVYRIPLSALSKIKTQNINDKAQLNSEIISLNHFQTSEQVFHFMELLREKGASLSISTRLKGMGQQKALIEIMFSGTHEDLKKFLDTGDFSGIKKGKLDFEFVASPLNIPKDVKTKTLLPTQKEEVSL
jgi:hypothetical protein